MEHVCSEHKVQAAVVSTPGAIGISQVSAQLESTTLRVRLQKDDGSIVSESVTASYKCLIDTWNATTMRFKPSTSLVETCWTFTTFLYSMVRLDNIAGQCTNAPRALKFLQYLHSRK
jgi:hypothetical protein